MFEIRRRALTARLRNHHRVVAVVAARAPPRSTRSARSRQAVLRAMDRERHAAVGALEGIAALTAEDRRRVPAPVQKDEHLLTAVEPLADRSSEIAADDDV